MGPYTKKSVLRESHNKKLSRMVLLGKALSKLLYSKRNIDLFKNMTKVTHSTSTEYANLDANHYPSKIGLVSDDPSLGLTEDQKMYQKMAQDFANNEMRPHMERWDKEEIFPVETMRHAASLGFGAICASEQHSEQSTSQSWPPWRRWPRIASQSQDLDRTPPPSPRLPSVSGTSLY